jgi:hypothetical protein
MASRDPQVFDRALPAGHGLQHYRSLNAALRASEGYSGFTL